MQVKTLILLTANQTLDYIFTNKSVSLLVSSSVSTIVKYFIRETKFVILTGARTKKK